MVALGLALAWLDHRPWVRVLAHAQATGWLLFALVPGTFVGVALEAAYNTPATANIVYRGPAILVLAHLAYLNVGERFDGAQLGTALRQMFFPDNRR